MPAKPIERRHRERRRVIALGGDGEDNKWTHPIGLAFCYWPIPRVSRLRQRKPRERGFRIGLAAGAVQ